MGPPGAQPGGLHQIPTEGTITTILKAVREVAIAALKWQCSWLLPVAAMIVMALPEAGPLVGQGREPWAFMMEAISAAKAWLTRPDNIHEMDDQFYIWRARCTCIKLLSLRNLASLKATTLPSIVTKMMDGGKQKSTAEMAKLGWSQATTSSLVKWKTNNELLLCDGAFLLLLLFLFPFAPTPFIFPE